MSDHAQIRRYLHLSDYVFSGMWVLSDALVPGSMPPVKAPVGKKMTEIHLVYSGERVC